jgi:hypothetical protein
MTFSEFALSIYSHFDFSCISPNMLERINNTEAKSVKNKDEILNTIISMAIKQMLFDSSELFSEAMKEKVQLALQYEGLEYNPDTYKVKDSQFSRQEHFVDIQNLAVEIRIRAELLLKYKISSTKEPKMNIPTIISFGEQEPKITISGKNFQQTVPDRVFVPHSPNWED